MNFQRIRDLEQKVALKTATALEKEELELHQKFAENLAKQEAANVKAQAEKDEEAPAAEVEGAEPTDEKTEEKE